MEMRRRRELIVGVSLFASPDDPQDRMYDYVYLLRKWLPVVAQVARRNGYAPRLLLYTDGSVPPATLEVIDADARQHYAYQRVTERTGRPLLTNTLPRLQVLGMPRPGDVAVVLDADLWHDRQWLGCLDAFLKSNRAVLRTCVLGYKSTWPVAAGILATRVPLQVDYRAYLASKSDAECGYGVDQDFLYSVVWPVLRAQSAMVATASLGPTERRKALPPEWCGTDDSFVSNAWVSWTDFASKL